MITDIRDKFNIRGMRLFGGSRKLPNDPQHLFDSSAITGSEEFINRWDFIFGFFSALPLRYGIPHVLCVRYTLFASSYADFLPLLFSLIRILIVSSKEILRFIANHQIDMCVCVYVTLAVSF